MPKTKHAPPPKPRYKPLWVTPEVNALVKELAGLRRQTVGALIETLIREELEYERAKAPGYAQHGE